MKKLLTLLFFATKFTLLSAQIQKGSIMLGGAIGFNHTSVNDEGVTVVSILPTIGSCLSNRFAVGSTLGLTVVFDGTNSNTAAILSPFARAYFNDKTTNRFFAQLNAGIESNDLISNRLWLFGLGLGADFFISKDMAIECTIGYKHSQDAGQDVSINTIGVNFGIAGFLSNVKKE